MGHGLEQPTDMIYHGTKPWHNLGVELSGPMTVQEVLDYCPRFADKVLKVPAELDGAVVPNHFFTIRNDDRTVLGHVGTEYRILQNADMLRMAERIFCDPNGPVLDTAGILWNGRKAWALAKFPDDMRLVGRNGQEDVIRQYLLLSNAHDGSQTVRIQATPIRVVCQNTLNVATHSANRETSALVHHSGDVTQKVRNAADLLKFTREAFAMTHELYAELARSEPTKEQVDQVLKHLIPATKSDRANLQRARVLELAETGVGNAPFVGTAWALYNGVTELSDHYNNAGSKREDAEDMRVHSAWFGSGAMFKAKALDLIATHCL